MTNYDLLDRIARLGQNALRNGQDQSVDSFCQLGLMLAPEKTKGAGVFYHLQGLKALSSDDVRSALPHLRSALECYAQDTGLPALEAYRNTIIAHLMDDDHQAALDLALHAQKSWPKDATLLHLSAQAAEGAGDITQATEFYEHALAQTLTQKPDREDNIVEIAFNLGTLFYKQHKLDKAYTAYRKVLDIQPKNTKAWCNLGNVLSDMAHPAEAYKAYETALRINPDYKNAHSNLLQTLHYLPDQTAASLLPPHKAWAKRHMPKSNGRPPPPPPRDRIAVGLISEDLRKHPVGYFCKEWLPYAREAGIEIVAYCDNRENDDLTYELKAHATHWHYVDRDTDEDLTRRIRKDAPDILLDLAGHTGRNRLAVFGNRPCANQASWMGYVGTTGLEQMDGLIADRIHVPIVEDKAYAEDIWRMPNGYVCYAPPELTLEPENNACQRNGYVSFAAFHNPAKINATVIAAWAKILLAIDGARIRFAYRGYDDPNTQDFISRTFLAHGVPSDRLEFHPQLSHQDLLALYNACDFALDAFPYSGGLTTLEALWMGIPVITAPGRTFASRHSTSHLTFGGFKQDVTTGTSDYIRTAIAWAHSPIMRDADRNARRARFEASPLRDGKTFANDLNAMLTTKIHG